jgi:hypothetical protein
MSPSFFQASVSLILEHQNISDIILHQLDSNYCLILNTLEKVYCQDPTPSVRGTREFRSQGEPVGTQCKEHNLTGRPAACYREQT